MFVMSRWRRTSEHLNPDSLSDWWIKIGSNITLYIDFRGYFASRGTDVRLHHLFNDP